MPAQERTPAIPGNKGASIPDVEAVAGKESIDDWRRTHGIDKSQQIQITKVSHMRYQHPDLEVITTFLEDFGMQVARRAEDKVWFRGYGPDQYVYFAQKGPKAYLGGTFEVETYEDLLKASKLPNAGPVESLEDAPGGGSMVTVIDPEGFPVNFIQGQAPAEVTALPESVIVNSVTEKPRVKKFQRFEPGPAAIHKLGHFGLVVQDFAQQMAWYTRHFNLVPSDLLYTTDDQGNQTDVSIFAHIDRGSELVDHHTIFFSRGAKSHVHHCSFEVHDYDTQHLGHQWLARKNYKSVWGVGRHILGSQIFDYWWDPNGNMVEHYSDGDLVDDKTPVGHLPVSMESLSVWGPEVPSDFLD